jgi:hypothetical protein
MRNLFFTLFAVSVAAVAAMTATTAMINAPVRKMPEAMVSALTQAEPAPPEQTGGAPTGTNAPATPGTPPAAGATPDAGAPADTKAAPADEGEADKDPYEGIAPDELPPDLQYSADSSVSFPTNI